MDQLDLDYIPIIAYFFPIPVVGSACLERAGCTGSQELGERAWNNIQRCHHLDQGTLNPVMRWLETPFIGSVRAKDAAWLK